jgi:hypothetical protein
MVAGVITAALVLGLAATGVGQDAERLPPVDLPYEPLPAPDEVETPRAKTTPASQPSTSQPEIKPVETYSGPPTSIDGPERPPATVIPRSPPADLQRLPPPTLELPAEEIAPGLGQEHEITLPDSPLAGELDDEMYFDGPQKLSPYKDGFFQKLSLSAGWIGNSKSPDDVGVTEVEAYLTVALPAPIREWPLLITPAYQMIFLAGPGVTDLPPRLNTVYVDFLWLPQVYGNLKLFLSVAPSVYTDFQARDPDMFRVTGRALGIYDWDPDRLQIIAGVLYLGRDDVQILPAGGVIWKPADWTYFELLFPKPKLSVRLNVGTGYEDWIYTTAEFGGNTWSIERISGLDDKVTYLDYRILLGMERKLNGGAGYRLEGGYVFGREVTFASGIGDFNPKDSFILRGGISY